jgi:hypothetical protein
MMNACLHCWRLAHLSVRFFTDGYERSLATANTAQGYRAANGVGPSSFLRWGFTSMNTKGLKMREAIAAVPASQRAVDVAHNLIEHR